MLGSFRNRSIGFLSNFSHFTSATSSAMPSHLDSLAESLRDLAADKSHHKGSRYRNPFKGFARSTNLTTILKWMRERSKAGLPGMGHGYLEGNLRASPEDFLRAFPVVPLDSHALHNPPQDHVQCTWLGHASVLVRMEGVSILTDPVWSQRCSPFSFMGPKRVVPPPVDLSKPLKQQIGSVDIVLISHNHYDHLDNESVKLLESTYGSSLVWAVPLGVKSTLKSFGVTGQILELDWYEHRNLRIGSTEAAVVLLPTQHFSGRGLLDRDATLWSSIAVITPRFKFWFAGDTGYSPDLFKTIGERLGPFDLAAVPIGAYLPVTIMKPVHVDPEEAVKIHQDVRAKKSVSIHWGTFSLTDEPLDEPPVLLRRHLQQAGVPSADFLVMDHGETVNLGDEASLKQRDAVRAGAKTTAGTGGGAEGIVATVEARAS